MKKTGLMMLTVAVLVLAGWALTQSGCGGSDVQQLSNQTKPLCIRRAGGKVQTITFAQAMEWHHEHEDHAGAVTSATPKKSSKAEPKEDHDDGLCVGVATGYQAIRYAAGRLFPGETPTANDFELSVAGSMRGIWDIFDLYTGKKLARPKKKSGKMSLKSFTFKARRIPTGKTLTFRLRDGLIPAEFFAMKNRGVSCGDEALEAFKKQAARKILSASPEECFEPPAREK